MGDIMDEKDFRITETEKTFLKYLIIILVVTLILGAVLYYSRPLVTGDSSQLSHQNLTDDAVVEGLGAADQEVSGQSEHTSFYPVSVSVRQVGRVNTSIVNASLAVAAEYFCPRLRSVTFLERRGLTRCKHHSVFVDGELESVLEYGCTRMMGFATTYGDVYVYEADHDFERVLSTLLHEVCHVCITGIFDEEATLACEAELMNEWRER